jgi:hypothetical protein
VGRRQDVAPEHDLDGDAVELAYAARLPPLAGREWLAHDSELDVDALLGQEEVLVTNGERMQLTGYATRGSPSSRDSPSSSALPARTGS